MAVMDCHALMYHLARAGVQGHRTRGVAGARQEGSRVRWEAEVMVVVPSPPSAAVGAVGSMAAGVVGVLTLKEA